MKTVSCDEIRLMDAFASPISGPFADTLRAGAGLSFSHSGLSHAQVLDRLRIVEDVRDDSNPGYPKRRVHLEDSENGLCVTVEYNVHAAHRAVVYGATLHNGGARNIEQVRQLRSYDLTVASLEKVGDPRLHTIGGGLTDYFYPPLAYRLQQWHLLGPTQTSIDSGPTGRGSNKDMPFFFLEDGDRCAGIYGGIEWSGIWHIRFVRRDEPKQVHYGHLGPDKSLWIEGGMDEVDFLLRTGETFCMPRVLLGFYDGCIEKGRNALRRFISDWAPQLADGTPMPQTQATPGGYCEPTESTTDARCRAHAAANAQIGVEYYVIENWFESLAHRPDTRATGATGAARGSWEPDTARFADLEDCARFVRSQGMKFGLWTDIEVAHAESRVAREHPQWILYLEGNPVGLVNMGLPEAQDWAIGVYDRLVERYGIEWIFYDNNINPGPYWQAHEAPHRRGWMQHDYIRGVWRMWDETRRRHPNVVIENCSSGGRRIDLGTVGRAHCNVISDQFRHPDSIRYQFSGANTVLPGDRLKSIICVGLDHYPDYVFHSNFGGLVSITEGIESWSAQMKQQARQHLDVYKSIRRYLSKDYYSLFGQPQSLEAWDGWQFHDPQSDEGFFLLFRVRSPQEQASARLRALDAGAKYLLTDPYSGKEQVAAGGELIERGLLVSLPPNGSRLLCYRRR